MCISIALPAISLAWASAGGYSKWENEATRRTELASDDDSASYKSCLEEENGSGSLELAGANDQHVFEAALKVDAALEKLVLAPFVQVFTSIASAIVDATLDVLQRSAGTGSGAGGDAAAIETTPFLLCRRCLRNSSSKNCFNAESAPRDAASSQCVRFWPGGWTCRRPKRYSA